MRNAAPWLILLCLTGCALRAAPGTALWPDPQVARDVAAIRAGMDQARTGADRMAAQGDP